jgi:hypothetical protein
MLIYWQAKVFPKQMQVNVLNLLMNGVLNIYTLCALHLFGKRENSIHKESALRCFCKKLSLNHVHYFSDFITCDERYC